MNWPKIRTDPIIHPYRRWLIFFPFVFPAGMVLATVCIVVEWFAWLIGSLCQRVIFLNERLFDRYDALAQWACGFSPDVFVQQTATDDWDEEEDAT